MPHDRIAGPHRGSPMRLLGVALSVYIGTAGLLIAVIQILSIVRT